MSYRHGKRTVFIAFDPADRIEAEAFIHRWSQQESVFVARTARPADSGPSRQEEPFTRHDLAGAKVTIVLVGKETHANAEVDAQIRVSLEGEGRLPNGLIGIILPSCGDAAIMPPRLRANWARGHFNCFARYWAAPSTADQLDRMIEDAYTAHTASAHLVRRDDSTTPERSLAVEHKA